MYVRLGSSLAADGRTTHGSAASSGKNAMDRPVFPGGFVVMVALASCTDKALILMTFVQAILDASPMPDCGNVGAGPCRGEEGRETCRPPA